MSAPLPARTATTWSGSSCTLGRPRRTPLTCCRRRWWRRGEGATPFPGPGRSERRCSESRGARAIQFLRGQARHARRRRAVTDSDLEVVDVVGDRPLDVQVADRSALGEAVSGMPLDQREAVVLAFVVGLPLAEVAQVQGVPVVTVKRRILIGRAAVGPSGACPVPPHRREGISCADRTFSRRRATYGVSGAFMARQAHGGGHGADLIPEYLGGALGADARASFESHVATCAD